MSRRTYFSISRVIFSRIIFRRETSLNVRGLFFPPICTFPFRRLPRNAFPKANVFPENCCPHADTYNCYTPTAINIHQFRSYTLVNLGVVVTVSTPIRLSKIISRPPRDVFRLKNRSVIIFYFLSSISFGKGRREWRDVCRENDAQTRLQTWAVKLVYSSKDFRSSSEGKHDTERWKRYKCTAL